MKKILCFGDSNTFGFIPKSGERYDKDIRWTGVLQNLCGSDYEIIEAGCNNRTCFVDNPAGKEFTGYKALPEYLKPDLDCVILAVGINDLQKFFETDEIKIKNGIETLINFVQTNCKNAKILVISPAKLTDDVLKGYFAFQFDKKSIEKSLKISEIYSKSAKEKGCYFLDLDKIVKVSPLDGLHFEPEQHKKIAQAVCEGLSEIFTKSPKETF